MIDWKNNPKRKPLLLQGARQVGKTYLVNRFGKKEYSDYINLKSLRSYADKYKPKLIFRTSPRNFVKDKESINIPFYAVSLIPTLAVKE